MQKEEKENSRLLMENLVKDQVPIGGWYFNEGKIIIKDETFDKLVLAVVAHRINNGKPMGSAAKEIEEQILNRGRYVNVP